MRELVYYFRCQKCGLYPVEEEAFDRFLPPNIWSELNQRIKGGAPGATLEFEADCPRCLSFGVRKAKVIILSAPH